MDDNKIISNTEGLTNPTILQRLLAMQKYVIENAVKGDKGAVGIFSVDADYAADTQYYAISAVRNYVADQFVGQPVYFNNGFIGIVAQVYASTPVASPAFTVANIIDTRGPQGAKGDPGESTTVDSVLSPASDNPVENKVIYNNITNLQNEIDDANEQILEVSEDTQDLETRVKALEDAPAGGTQLYQHIITINTPAREMIGIISLAKNPASSLVEVCDLQRSAFVANYNTMKLLNFYYNSATNSTVITVLIPSTSEIQTATVTGVSLVSDTVTAI